MRIMANIQALRTTNTLERIQNSSIKTNAKLSSGVSINRAADNASGLAISEKMRAQIRGLDRADRNIQDAKSLMNTAESGLDTITSMMQRMRGLAISSLNDTNTELDRQLIQEEFQQLQYAIDDATNHSEWSGKPVIDNHSPAFNKIEGNHVFPKTTAVKIISGLNDDLEVVIDGVSRTLTLPEGDYEPVDVLIDVLDDLLMDIDPNLIAHVTEDRTISIQAEDSQSIDYIKGGASFLLYEYTLGNPPGMIIGTTKYEENGVVDVQPGKSDLLTFYVGNGEQIEIRFPKGEHTQSEIIDIINDQLKDLEQEDVEAIQYGDRIAITSNKYVITGVGGNMIEIDDITSVLYDNRQSGYISKSQAVVTGAKDLSENVTFTSKNSELHIYIEGVHVPVNFLPESTNEMTLNKNQIIDKINKAIKEKGVEAKASLTTSNRLQITSDYFGQKSSVIIEDETSTSFDDLFVGFKEGYYDDIPVRNGTNASLMGYYTIEDITTIKSGENILTGKIGNKEFSIELEEGDYTKEELLKVLNEKAQTLPIEFSLTENGKSALMIENTETGVAFMLDKASPLFDTLMSGTRVVTYSPSIKSGTSTKVQSPEGLATAPTYTHTPATVTGESSLVGLEVTNENNEMSFTLNGDKVELFLKMGTYETADEFIEAHQQMFDDVGIRISTTPSNQLILETKEVGANQSITNINGSSYASIMEKKIESEEVPGNSATSTSSSITGTYEIPNVYQVDDLNNTFTFNYKHGGTEYELEIEIEEGTYPTPSSLGRQMSEKISEALETKSLPPDAIDVSISQSGRLTISASNPGTSYGFSKFEGNLFDELFRKYEKTTIPNAFDQGTRSEKDTYIIGRDIVKDEEFIIHPEINDLLYIDFKQGGKTTTLELKLTAGEYKSHTQLITEINEKLTEELERREIRADLVQAQLGGVPNSPIENFSDKLVFKVNRDTTGVNDSGSYVIDSVRGTAAYTFFYPSQGDPEPSYTIGVADLSGGATITEGKNDTFIFDVDNVTKEIVLPAGSYQADELLEELNKQLNNESAGVIASYFEGKLKLSTTETGQIPIDGIRGNARGTLFYETDTRKENREWTFQTGANTGDNVQMDKVRASAKLLRINTVMLDDPARAEKALDRLDAALKTISQERSKIGAYINRLDHTMNSVRVTGENLSASESLIRDTDIAKEILKKVKNDLLQSASQQMLAHANNNPQKILELLR